jgi:acetylornithine deacetylase/succinyl-diaminopimelate desuccinylase-like protein
MKPTVNIKFVFEGEEEAGSPHLAEYLEKYAADLAVDAWILCDGPVHQSRRPQIYYGARGVVDVELTVYGPNRALHSGHYGNWAPNPIVTLTHLVASMRDTEARIAIDGYYDDVVAVSEAEKRALAQGPKFDAEIRRELSLGRTEGSATLNEQILLPALNLRGISGGAVGEKASNSIPTEARASIDFRLVPNQTPERVQQLVEAHIARRGFHIVRGTPDAATRAAYPNVIKVNWGHGYPAARTAMDLPLSRRVAEIAGSDAVLLPSLGGSIPMYLFQRGKGHRRADRQPRQQPARGERKPPPAEPVGRHRPLRPPLYGLELALPAAEREVVAWTVGRRVGKAEERADGCRKRQKRRQTAECVEHREHHRLLWDDNLIAPRLRHV